MTTIAQLRSTGKPIKDGTAAFAVIRNGRGEETGRITVYYNRAHDRFFSIPQAAR